MSRMEERAMQAPARQHVPLPHRNLSLLSVAVSFAAQVGAPSLALALNAEDLGAFVEAFRALAAALSPPVALVTPLSHMSKAHVASLGASLGVPWEATYSCMVGRARHCGRCSQCRQRRAAFELAGVPEKDDFYES
eukprot:jgi/Mesen1/2573/ME000162S01702